MNKPAPLPDLHSLQVFQSVSENGSFTAAGQHLGLTQSAVSRQIQQLEAELGTDLLHRTTRSVHLTEAGKSFLQSSSRILHDFEQNMLRFQERHLNQTPQVRLALSHSIAHSHLPGLLVHFRRSNPDTRIFITYESSERIAQQILNHEVDLAIFTQANKTPAKLQQLHAFQDDFVIITPPKNTNDPQTSPNYSWLALDHNSTTGALLKQWIVKLQPDLHSRTELSNFDLIINLVALGLGSSIVPRRALRPYGHRLQVDIAEPKTPLQRTIGVYAEKSANRNPTIQQFVDSILFGWKATPQS